MKKTTEQFIKESRVIHGDDYDYSKVKYINNHTNIIISCPKHGDFNQLPNGHLRGRGCPECGVTKVKKITTKKIGEFISEANKIHNSFYDYSKVEYTNARTKIKITCPIHGDFKQQPRAHIDSKSPQGCPECGKLKRSTNKTLTTKQFIIDAQLIHGVQYNYSLTNYYTAKTPVKIICETHGVFNQAPDKHKAGHGCPKCSHSGPSKGEQEIVKYLKLIGITGIQQSNRGILKQLELDIYIPSHNIAIEYDGLYWHSNKFKPNNYHLNKTELCEKKGIQLIHIFENEWVYEQDLVKKRLWNLFNPDDLLPTPDYDLSKDYIELDRRYYNGKYLLGGDYKLLRTSKPNFHYVKGQKIVKHETTIIIYDCGFETFIKI